MEHENQHPSKFMNMMTGYVYSEEDNLAADKLPSSIAEIDVEILPLILAIINNKNYESTHSCQGGLIFDEESKYHEDTNVLLAFDSPYVVVHTNYYEDFSRLVDALIDYTMFTFTVSTSNVTVDGIIGCTRDYKISITISDDFVTALFEMGDITKKVSDNYELIKEIMNKVFENKRDKWIKTLIKIFDKLDELDEDKS